MFLRLKLQTNPPHSEILLQIRTSVADLRILKDQKSTNSGEESHVHMADYLLIEEERINSSQSVVYDGIILA